MSTTVSIPQVGDVTQKDLSIVGDWLMLSWYEAGNTGKQHKFYLAPQQLKPLLSGAMVLLGREKVLELLQ